MHILLKTIIKNEHFENISFFFAPWYQGTECVPIIIGPTIELNLGTMQKHQNLVSNMLPSTSGTAHTSMNPPFLCWKLGQFCHFGSNGPLYIFDFTFLDTVFCFVFCCCCCFFFFFFFYHYYFEFIFYFLLLFLFS